MVNKIDFTCMEMFCSNGYSESQVLSRRDWIFLSVFQTLYKDKDRRTKINVFYRSFSVHKLKRELFMPNIEWERVCNFVFSESWLTTQNLSILVTFFW